MTERLKGRVRGADGTSMPRMRQMLAGLGASASLAAAGALALLVVSAVIALEGFPGMNPDAGGRRLAVADLTVPTSDPTAAAVAPDRVIAADPEPAVPRPAAAPGAAGGGQEPPVASPVPVDPGSGDTPPGGPGPGGGGGPGPGPGPVTRPDEDPDRFPLPLPDDPVRDLTGTTGGLVGDTGEDLGGLVDRILPGSGKLVRGTTAVLDGTVRETGETLGDTLDVVLSG